MTTISAQANPYSPPWECGAGALYAMRGYLTALITIQFVHGTQNGLKSRNCDATSTRTSIWEASTDHSGGCWIVYQTNLAYASGGATTLHQLAGTLLREGACVKMAYVNRKLARHVSTSSALVDTVNMSHLEVQRLFEQGLGAADTLIAAEIDPLFVVIEEEIPYPHLPPVHTSTAADVRRAVRALERNGGVVARYMLGHFEGWGDSVSSEVSTHFGGSIFLHKAFAGSGMLPVPGPLNDSTCLQAREWRSSIGGLSSTMVERKLFYDSNGNLSALVAYDDDTDIDHGALQNELDACTTYLPYRLVAKQFKGLSYDETLPIFRSAVVFVDLHMPGSERATLEFMQFGAVNVLSVWGNHEPSSDDGHLPIIRIANHDAKSVAAAVVSAIARESTTSEGQFLRREKWLEYACDGSLFRNVLREHRASRRRKWLAVIDADTEYARIAPMVASIASHHVYGDLTVVGERSIDVGEGMKWRVGSAFLDALQRLGLKRRLRVIQCSGCNGTINTLTMALASLSEPYMETVLLDLRKMTLAPSVQDLQALQYHLESGFQGCYMNGQGAALCRTGAMDFETAQENAIKFLLGAQVQSVNADTCEMLLQHSLWQLLYPSLSPPAKQAADAACSPRVSTKPFPSSAYSEGLKAYFNTPVRQEPRPPSP